MFSIPFGAPFLATAARALVDGTLLPDLDRSDPLALASVTVYAPTRRAARGLAGAIAAAQGGRVQLLPRIAPLGAIDEDAEGRPRDPEAADVDADPAIPAAIGDLARRLALTRLTLGWGRALKGAILWADGAGPRVDERESNLVASTPAAALGLAGELAALLDEMIIEDVDWAKLDGLATGELDRYWAITLDFLKIAREHWPDELARRGLVDAARRRAALIARETARLREGRAGPVVALGSTGSNRATARLIAAIAAAPQGAVVLPGLDQSLDDEGWRAIDVAEADGLSPSAGHPQTALKRLLGELGLQREDVKVLGVAPEALAQRGAWLSDALRPAATTHVWARAETRPAPGALAPALAGVRLVEAGDEREEALAVAVALREALEVPGRRAALVTPDRGLARRVRAEMRRWGVTVEDSAGASLGRSPAGALARLIAECAAEGFPALRVAALLAHADVTLGLGADAEAIVRADLDAAVLRGPIAADALADPAGLVASARRAAADRHAHRAARALDPARWAGAETALTRLAEALAPLRLAGAAPLPRWIDAHRAALAAIERPAAEARPDRAARDELMEEFAQSADDGLILTAEEYAAFFDRLIDSETLAAPEDGHPRLRILGALEARLIDADLVVLGALDETIWPPRAETDAFLNRPMRAAVGLSAPERRLGQSAHDFVMGMGAGEVTLTRALRRGGKPTVASRLVQRLGAVTPEPAWTAMQARGERLLALARSLDAPRAADDPSRLQPVARPAPRPAVALRPRRLSVTQIETLLRDPYAICAARIYDLAPLEAFDAEEEPRLIGQALHDIIARFSAPLPKGPLPADARAQIRGIARRVLAGALDDPVFAARDWPRLVATLDRYLDWEAARRHFVAALATEAPGALDLTLADGSSFRLTAVADRIEQLAGLGAHVVDFKTGQLPYVAEVKAGYAPQLTLEAAMLARGGFAFALDGDLIEGLYVGLGPAKATERRAGGAKADFAALVERDFQGCVSLLSTYRDVATGYPSLPAPEYAPKHSDYAHLARVAEWSIEGDEESDGEPGGET